MEVGNARMPVIEYRHAVGKGAVILGDRTVIVGRPPTVGATGHLADRGRRTAAADVARPAAVDGPPKMPTTTPIDRRGPR